MTTTDENPNKVDWASEWYAEHLGIDTAEIPPSCWQLVTAAHGEAIMNGHYHDPDTGMPIKYTVRELMALVIAELREATIADLDGAMDKHLPHRLGVEVEIADALIILFGACGYLGLDIGNAIVEKLEFNRTRADHKPAARRAAVGRK